VISEEFLRDLEAFSLIVRKRITSQYSGSRTSIQPGRGLTLKEYRPYTPGDDVRTIDWKVFARSDELFIKIFEEDRDLTVHVLIDATSSMDYGSSLSKYSYASMIAAGYLFLAMRGNERFRFAFMRDELEIHPLRRGRNHFATYVSEANAIKPEGRIDLAAAIASYLPLLRSKSLIIIVSDFLFEPSVIEESVGQLNKHDVQLIRVLDADEKTLPLEGDYRLKDLESGERLRTFISLAARQQYLDRLESHTAMIEELASSLGFGFSSVTSDEPIFDAFHRLIRS
jgi:uncharacterized protein (DUF58 family)